MSNSETQSKPAKTPRVVHYDLNEVRKYMRKRRVETRQKRRADIETKAHAKTVKEEKLKQLMERQHQAAAASAATSRRKMVQLQQIQYERVPQQVCSNMLV